MTHPGEAQPDERDDTAMHRLLGDPSRRRILDLLASGSPRDAHELAAATRLHATTVRSHLLRLASAGLVTAARQRLGARGRPRTVYSVVPGDVAVTADPAYRELAGALVERLAADDAGPDVAMAAGHAWGGRLAARADGAATTDRGRSQLVALMGSLGFAPDASRHRDEILLARCPLADVALRHPEIVCALHRGLLQGALDGAGAPVAVTSLLPFADAGRCVVRLADNRDFAAADPNSAAPEWR
ncbi:MAG TPA: ArsR family transcriptional regulator [Egibacteraceae bacterium]|nr:ArsR family transcriptional regulator [Egibacteraceae bacterium]